MKSNLLGVVVVLLAAELLVAPVPAAAQQRQRQSWPVDLIVMPVTHRVRAATASPDGDSFTSSYGMQGIEAFVIGRKSGLGVGGRHIIGPTIGVERKAQNSDAYLLLGDESFHLDAGYSLRTHGPTDTTYQFARGGFSTTIYLGTSGVALRARAGYYVPIKKNEIKGTGPEGWEGETSVAYTWPRFPVFAQLGYRMERFKTLGWEEEVSAVTLGAGIWLWGR